jgi:hypothetical protein
VEIKAQGKGSRKKEKKRTKMQSRTPSHAKIPKAISHTIISQAEKEIQETEE